MSKQLSLFKEEEVLPVWVNGVPFVDEVEEFNRVFNKPNNYEPTIPSENEWRFVYDFILEELEEYKDSVSKRCKEQGEACHFEKVEEGRYVVYRTRDRKVMKSESYFRPNLKQFFSVDDIARTRPQQHLGI